MKFIKRTIRYVWSLVLFAFSMNESDAIMLKTTK